MAKRCEQCKGSGTLNCNLCAGRKYMKAHVALQAKGRFVAAMNEDVACPVCEGSGGSRCWNCSGTGHQQKSAWWKFGKSRDGQTGSSSLTELENQLFHAVKNQGLDKVKSLLTQDVDCNAIFENGWTCLHEAATTGPAELLELLIKHGAKLEKRTEEKALTPLHVAALWQQPKAARVLVLSGADKAAISKAGKMPRDYALGLGNSQLAFLLSTERRYL